MIPTEHVDSLIYYFPDADSFSSNFETVGIESKLLLANVGFALWLIYLNALFMIVHAIISMTKTRRTCMMKLQQKLGSYLYWNGLTRLYMELFFQLMLLGALNLHTAEWNSPFESVQKSNLISLFIITLICSVLVTFVIIYFCAPREKRIRKLKKRCSTLL